MLVVVQKFPAAIARLVVAGLLLGLSGCAAVQMQSNVENYDAAIAESANSLLLVNAVRASQRYPMSFASVGGVSAAPQLAGAVQGVLNFSNLAGFTTASVTPNVSTIAPGYSQFSLSNLNDGESMERLRNPVPPQVIDSFRKSAWPTELINLLYTLELEPTREEVLQIDKDRRMRCAHPTKLRDAKLCDMLEKSMMTYASRCPDHFGDRELRMKHFRDDRNLYYNSAATYCHYARFQIFMREMRLLDRKACFEKNPPRPPASGTTVTSKEKSTTTVDGADTGAAAGPRTVTSVTKDTVTKTAPTTGPAAKQAIDRACIKGKVRTALQMIQYLGQLIAAQHYIESPFTPMVLIGHSTDEGTYDYVEVPLFVVKRGIELPGRAAVVTRHQGHYYYIPQPEFGSVDEARSLQVMDLVLQTARAATQKSDIPKTLPGVAVVSP